MLFVFFTKMSFTAMKKIVAFAAAFLKATNSFEVGYQIGQISTSSARETARSSESRKKASSCSVEL